MLLGYLINMVYNKRNKNAPTESKKLRLPVNNEVIGLLEQRLGAGRSKVRCMDSKTRVCRVPGKLQRYLWLRENDIVLVLPWEFEGHIKGDIIYKYKSINEISQLRELGYLKTLEDVDEF